MVQTVHAEQHPLPDATAIEQELRRLWREVGDSEKPMMRARVLSLLVVSDERHESQMTEQLVQLAERHPARNVLLLVGPANGEERFDASVTLLCGMNQRALCAEQILLHATGAARQRLPGAVRTLMTVNLPVVLWWTLAPNADPDLLKGLRPLADHLILDSAQLAGVADLCALPAEWFKGRTTDLNWSRLTTWREHVAQFFDAPACRTFLPQLETVEIEAGSNGVAGWLLAGWLASRLDWQVQSASDNALRFHKPEGGAVVVSLRRAEGTAALYRVMLAGGGAEFRLQRVHEALAESYMALPDGTALEQAVHLRDPQPAALLSRELDLLSRDPVYEAALAMGCEGLAVEG